MFQHRHSRASPTREDHSPAFALAELARVAARPSQRHHATVFADAFSHGPVSPPAGRYHNRGLNNTRAELDNVQKGKLSKQFEHMTVLFEQSKNISYFRRFIFSANPLFPIQ